MKALDLFSGIGGFTLALHKHDIKTVAFSEIEEYPSKILRQWWPDIPNLGDIRSNKMTNNKLNYEQLKENRNDTGKN